MAVADTLAVPETPKLWVPPEPSHLWVPDRVSSAGAAAVDFAASCGMELDEPQQLALDVLLSVRSDGKWAAFESALVACRQNLKTYVLMAFVLAKLYLFDDRLVVWSAHEFPTSEETFRDLETRVNDNPHLLRRVKNISHENGKEGIELYGDRRIRFRARTKTGGRGLSGDTVILDEAMKLFAAAVGSLGPTLLARPNPQLVYAGSAGKDQPEADVFRAVRDRGRKGGEPALAYIEYGNDDTDCDDERCEHALDAEGCSLDDLEFIARANPALYTRIAVSTILAMRRLLPPAEFARECGGVWEDPEESIAGLSIEKWNACAVAPTATGEPGSEIVADLVFAIVVAQDLSWSTIASAGVNKDGRVHGEVVEYHKGTDWVAVAMHEILTEQGEGRVLLDVSGPRSAIGAELLALDIEYTEVNAAELTESCGRFEDLLGRGALAQINQPELNVAVKGGRRKNVGEAWTWARRASLPLDISTVVGVTIAVGAVVAGDPEAGDDEAQVF